MVPWIIYHTPQFLFLIDATSFREKKLINNLYL